MPELPEIEHLKRTLEPALIGAFVRKVVIQRQDVVRCSSRSKRAVARELLAGQTITSLDRHGKQLAVQTAGPALCIHLGMSGQLRFFRRGEQVLKSDHVHCRWEIDGPQGCGSLLFRDPRRFGGIWTFSGMDALAKRWSCLGPDALMLRATKLAACLEGRDRPIKAALLDQHLVAGVGNIYADEALFLAQIHPLTMCSSLSKQQVQVLATAIRKTLRRAVAAGGSTLRDYSDANGEAGWFALEHAVYGRSGQACTRCGNILERLTVAQRTTVACPTCQVHPSRSYQHRMKRHAPLGTRPV